MLPIERKKVTAYVIFQGSPMRTFWRFFTCPGYRHVFVLLPIKANPKAGLLGKKWTLWIEPVGWGLAFEVLYEAPNKIAERMVRTGEATEAISYPLSLPPKRAYIPRGLWSCVTTVKAVLGLQSWMIITPLRLAEYLRRNGGKRIL